MSKAIRQFLSIVKKSNMISEDCYSASTAVRKTLIIPAGFKVYDSDLGMVFTGDGISYGGKSSESKEEVRTIVTTAASAFTSNDTFKTVTKAEDGVFTSASHGFSVGTVITMMSSTDATYGLTQDANYTVATVPTAHTFTLTGVTPEDRTADVVVRLYSIANNNKLTWAQGEYLRTGDAITLAAGSGTLPTGLSATTYYIVKDDTAANGGIDKNVTKVFRLSDSRAHALAGTNILKVRDAGSVGFTAVTTDVYLRDSDKVVMASTAVATSVFLPAGSASLTGKRYEIAGIGSANCTVKAVSGTVGGSAAGTGLVLKANSLDYVTVVCDGTNWTVLSKQITSAE